MNDEAVCRTAPATPGLLIMAVLMVVIVTVVIVTVVTVLIVTVVTVAVVEMTWGSRRSSQKWFLLILSSSRYQKPKRKRAKLAAAKELIGSPEISTD